MSGVHFVLQDGTKRETPRERRAIRRHVMLGKNRGKMKDPKPPVLKGCAIFRQGDMSILQTAQPPVPQRVGSDLSLVTFADTIEPQVMYETLQFCLTSEAKVFGALAPLINFEASGMLLQCREALASDTLHVNVMVFGSQSYMNHVFERSTLQSRHGSGDILRNHFGKALRLLHERMGHVQSRPGEVCDITLMSVVSLAINALVSRDFANARNHVVGLRRLVAMRCGKDGRFRGRTKQMIEILRCDLSISLATGLPPLLPSANFCLSVQQICTSAANKMSLANRSLPMDAELLQIWHVLSDFSCSVDKAAATRVKILDQLLLETITKAAVRLLDISYHATSVDELIRLAMIAFCVNTILAWSKLRLPLDAFELLFQQPLPYFVLTYPAHLVLWYLVMCGICLSELDGEPYEGLRQCLRGTMGKLQITDWLGARSVLKDLLWIDVLCAPSAQQLIEGIFAKQTTSNPV